VPAIPDAVSPSLLHPWESFYVIVGSSAAALTGLQFVVIALIAESRRRSTPSEINAFATPTIVHFCAVLLLSATLSAPWREVSGALLVVGACGAAGVVYALLVTRRASRQTGYKLVLEDWLWHTAFPLLAYGLLLAGALAIWRHPEGMLFTIAGVSLLLLFIGIHNAWDAVTYITIAHMGAGKEETKE
jgi:hypothetical protein